MERSGDQLDEIKREKRLNGYSSNRSLGSKEEGCFFDKRVVLLSTSEEIKCIYSYGNEPVGRDKASGRRAKIKAERFCWESSVDF